MGRKLSTAVLILILIIGIGVLGYPTFSNFYNERIGSYSISNYDKSISSVSEKQINAIFKRAVEYNKKFLEINRFSLTKEENEDYFTQLVLKNSDIMGYIMIKKINLKIPIYHSTSNAVLQKGIGHLEWSALPIGGIGNHSVLTGHRGLPTAKLFSNLDKLQVGDIVNVKILNKTLSYTVKKSVIVEPHEVGLLMPVKDRDLLTLITCTPYGVNTHRIFVICEKSETVVEEVVINEAKRVDPVILTPFIAVPILFLILIFTLIKKKIKKKG